MYTAFGAWYIQSMKRAQTEWIKKTLSHNLRQFRNEAGKSQLQVSKDAAISYRLLQELEAGNGNPTIETIASLARSFKVTSSRLLQLTSLRLPSTDADFISSIKQHFGPANIAFCLRTLNGAVIWGNKNAEILHGGISLDKGPVDLMELYSADGKSMMRQQLQAERRGFVSPYSLVMDASKNAEIKHLRIYPTILLPQKGSTPVFTATYITEMSEDCETNYFEYCELLFRSVTTLPQSPI
jgi:transcriptional regulator with XRE-family HTH domain